MRYIRTKDGIFKVLDYSTNCGESYYQIKPGNHGWIWTCSDDILKEADTIEELCDEFVGIDTQGHYIIHNNDFVEGARIIPLEKVDYYGAIWTEHGLKYIAKMNEKGELELL